MGTNQLTSNQFGSNHLGSGSSIRGSFHPCENESQSLNFNLQDSVNVTNSLSHSVESTHEQFQQALIDSKKMLDKAKAESREMADLLMRDEQSSRVIEAKLRDLSINESSIPDRSMVLVDKSVLDHEQKAPSD